MKLFGFTWFLNEHEKELQRLAVEEKRLKNEMLKNDIEYGNSIRTKEEKPNKPYLSMKLVGDTLTVVLEDGSVITKSWANLEDFKKVRSATSEAEILSLLRATDTEKETKEIRREQTISEGIGFFSDLEDFEVKDNTVTFRATERTIPPLLLEKFSEVIVRVDAESQLVNLQQALNQDDEYLALKRFFLWCCANPRAEVADKLYDFLDKNGMKITKQGFFVALRNVVDVQGSDPKFVDFVTNAYNKIKAIWKKKPTDYYVWQEDDGTYNFTKNGKESDGINKFHGNLEELYKNLSEKEENRFTDDYTRTFDIRIGKVVSMPKEDCNWSTQDCATTGLHFAGHTAPYVLCGNHTVFTLHNPMKVVGIGDVKGRCWEYLPFMLTTVEEADQIMNSQAFDFLQLDEEYAIRELEGLEEDIKDGFTKETTKYEFNLPTMSVDKIKNIVKSLSSMKEEISNRVNTL